MRVLDMAQGSPAWYAIRRGRPTGSNFSRLITPAKGEPAAAADTYAAELIAEACGWQSGFHGTPDTVRGTSMENEALRWLKMAHGYSTRQVGFCLSDCGRYGCSPDGLTPENIPVEVKAPSLHTFLKWRIAGGLPQDHKVQVHSEIYITGADKGIFLAYADHPALDNMVVIVERDEFTEKIGPIVEKFCDRLEALQRELLGEEFECIIRSPEEILNQKP
jgi:YqaJ-like viral recombinase domain